MWRKNGITESGFESVELKCLQNRNAGTVFGNRIHTRAKRPKEKYVEAGFALLVLLLVIAILIVLYLGLGSGLVRKPFTTRQSSKQKITEEKLISDIQKVISAGGSIDAPQNEYKHTYLHVAAKYGFMKAVVLCLDEGADIEALSYPARTTPLHRAAYNGHTAAVKLLVNRGANVEARIILERTVLKSAVDAETNREDIVAILLAAGADVDARDKHGSTPLSWAIDKGRLKVVNMLLDAGADITVKQVLGFTPLHEAARGGQVEIVKLLIKHGADVNAQDKDGSTPLDIASGAVVKILRSHGAKRGSEL